MRDEEKELLAAVERWCVEQQVDSLELFLLGGSALNARFDRAGYSKDLDVVLEPTRPHDEALVFEFGRASRRDPWLDLVCGGLPPLPIGFQSRATVIEGDWTRIRVYCLGTVDLVVSKLQRFIPRDRRHIQTICDLDPAVRAPLAALSEADFREVDLWEDTMAPRRDLVLDYLDGRRAHL